MQITRGKGTLSSGDLWTKKKGREGRVEALVEPFIIERVAPRASSGMCIARMNASWID